MVKEADNKGKVITGKRVLAKMTLPTVKNTLPAPKMKPPKESGKKKSK